MVTFRHPEDILNLGRFRKKVRTGFKTRDVVVVTDEFSAPIPWHENRSVLNEFLQHFWELGVEHLAGVEISARYETLEIAWLLSKDTYRRLFVPKFLGELEGNYQVYTFKQYLEREKPALNLPTQYKDFHLHNDFVFPLKQFKEPVLWLDNIIDFLLALEKGDYVTLQILFRPFPDIWQEYARYYINRLAVRKIPTNFVRFMYQQGPLSALLRKIGRKRTDMTVAPKYFKQSIKLIQDRLEEHLYQVAFRVRLRSVYPGRMRELARWSSKIAQVFENHPFNALVPVEHPYVMQEFEQRLLPPARFNLISFRELGGLLEYTPKQRGYLPKPTQLHINTSILVLPFDKGIPVGEVSVEGKRHSIGILPEDKQRNLVILGDNSREALHLLVNLITGEFSFNLAPFTAVIGDFNIGVFRALTFVLQQVYPNARFVPLAKPTKLAPFQVASALLKNIKDPGVEAAYREWVVNILAEYTGVLHLPSLLTLLQNIVTLLVSGVSLHQVMGLLLTPEQYKDIIKMEDTELSNFWYTRYEKDYLKDPYIKEETLKYIIKPLFAILKSQWYGGDHEFSMTPPAIGRLVGTSQLVFWDMSHLRDSKEKAFLSALLVSMLWLAKHAGGTATNSTSQVKGNRTSMDVKLEHREPARTLSFYCVSDLGSYTSILLSKPMNLTLFKSWKDVGADISHILKMLNSRIFLPIPFAQRVLVEDLLRIPPGLKKQIFELDKGQAVFDLVYKNRRIMPFTASVVQSKYVV